VTVITRVRDSKNKKEYLYTKGRLEGFNAGGEPVRIPIYRPEVWTRQDFDYKRTYIEKKGSFVIETLGPATSDEVYDIPFTAENVQALYDKAEGEVQFVLKDMQTGDAKSVNWSSVKDSRDLFCNKSFDYLWKADYIPAPVKAEYRQEAVTQGLIHGVQSDYAAPTSSAGKGGAYT
jgi:hypothetical protein